MIAQSRYSTVAIVLHWAIAFGILAQLATGYWMSRAILASDSRAAAFDMFQRHKSIGLTVLVLTLVRVAWRLTHRPPPLPEAIPRALRTMATLAHAGLYGLMLVTPILGWLMVSASAIGLPTLWFGLFEWPHWPISSFTADLRLVEDQFKIAHRLLAYGLALLVLVHVGAALKHHFLDRDEIVRRMVPGLRSMAK